MRSARQLLLGVALAVGCASETFDLLPRGAATPDASSGNGGAAGSAPGGAGGKPGAGAGGLMSMPEPSAGAENGGESPVAPCGSVPCPRPIVCVPGAPCVGCYGDADCVSFGGRCSPTQRRCVQCLPETSNVDCAAGLACDPATLRCAPACDGNAVDECPPGLVCDTAGFRNICVECTASTRCFQAPKLLCAGGTCVECTDWPDCSRKDPFRPICEVPTPSSPGFFCRGCRATFECGTWVCNVQTGACEPPPDEP